MTSMLMGLAVGDALGVPVEFMRRDDIAKDPVKGMRGYGMHGQPAGTWSDDTSLAFCLAEALAEGYDLERIAKKIVQWHDEGLWTPHGEMFDIGIATRQAIGRLRAGVDPMEAGGRDELSNGNGSLMRIGPLLYHIMDMDVEERWQFTREVSSITHGHLRSWIACFYFLEFARHILMGMDKFSAYAHLKSAMKTFLFSKEVDAGEVAHFSRLLDGNIHELPEDQIMSSGYVVHTLEASVWSVLTTGSYADAVLRAVNMGDDTDTTGAVTGALAGLLYGYDSIPRDWVKVLARREDVLALAAAFEK